MKARARWHTMKEPRESATGFMAVLKNYYAILGLEAFSDTNAVKAAFRKLARQHHPDLNGNNKQAEEKFKDINEAYEILSNPEKRAMHDAALKAVGISPKGSKAAPPKSKTTPPPTKQKTKPAEENRKKTETTSQSASSGTPINELFETFLKKGFTHSQTKSDPDEGIFRDKRDKKDSAPNNAQEKARRGEDVVVKTVITPQEASDGVVKTVNVQHNEICRRCSGTAKVNGSVCSACNGEKITVRLKKIDVRIPAGVKNGSRVRVAREGGRGTGNADNGDLFLQIEIAYDSSLRIEGLDVHGEVAISFTEAVLGGEIDAPTLHGPVKMQVPPGTQTGRVFRLKERGVHSSLTKGDHYVTVIVITPENLSAREKELYQELARLRPEAPKRSPRG